LDSLGRPLGNPTFTRRKDQNLTGRSGVRFTQDIRSTFNYGRRWGESIQGTSPSGNTEETMFWILGKKKPVRFPFVDVTMDWSGLEKIAFLSHVAQTVSLTSGISQKVTEAWQSQRSNVTQREHVRQWNPLLGVNFTWKGNIDSQVRYGVTNRFTDSPSGQTQRRSNENRVAATVSYTIRTGFRIPVMWLRSVRLQNQTTFSLNVDYSSTKQEQKRSDSDVFTLQPGSEMAWSLSPRMTYSFSNTVQGQGYVQLQQRKDAVTSSKSRVFEFGIQVNIAIRG
jgi:cell surface protein SprA